MSAGGPCISWPAFIPATLIVAILWTGTATLLGMLLLLRLPRLHHPVFAVPGFERASEDRFFLVHPASRIRASTRHAAIELLAAVGARCRREVPACD